MGDTAALGFWRFSVRRSWGVRHGVSSAPHVSGRGNESRRYGTRHENRMRAGLSISFSGEIPVIDGNGIPFRNFGDFWRISVNFGRFFLNFEFSKRNFPKIPKHFFPVPSGNEKFRRNSAKFRRNFKPWMRLPQTDKHDFNLLVLTSGASLKGVFFRISRTL